MLDWQQYCLVLNRFEIALSNSMILHFGHDQEENFKAIQCRSVVNQRGHGCRGIRGPPFGAERSTRLDQDIHGWCSVALGHSNGRLSTKITTVTYIKERERGCQRFQINTARFFEIIIFPLSIREKQCGMVKP